jgi:hypothetical protein
VLGPSGWHNVSPLPGFDPQTVQFTTSYYTGYTVMAFFTDVSENSVGKFESTHL